jgi:hypothetical protein
MNKPFHHAFSKRLLENDFIVAQQDRPWNRMKQMNEWDLIPVYHEKVQAGLKVVDKNDRPIFAPAIMPLLSSRSLT